MSVYGQGKSHLLASLKDCGIIDGQSRSAIFAPRRKLIAIGAYWRSDGPDGLNIIQRAQNGADLSESWKRAMMSYEAGAMGEDPATIWVTLLDQLQCIASHKDQLGDREVFYILGNVYLLEKYGKMPSDEYNGMVYNWVENGRQHFERHDA